MVVCMPVKMVRFCEWGSGQQTSAKDVVIDLKNCYTILVKCTEVIVIHVLACN